LIWVKLFLLVTGSAGLVWVSRIPLRSFSSHGFYRFFAWECILSLILLNLDHWFDSPFTFRQLVSWLFLIGSIFLVIHGVYLLKLVGKPDGQRSDDELINFEKTTRLVVRGAYRYIRHPLYSSLLFLAWGAFLKDISWGAAILVMAATVFLVLTARFEEKENIQFFGTEYEEYMRHTRMFVPFLF
jgi:protein-S-isoprenylcysteine O-methyltransferase Ste14